MIRVGIVQTICKINRHKILKEVFIPLKQGEYKSGAGEGRVTFFLSLIPCRGIIIYNMGRRVISYGILNILIPFLEDQVDGVECSPRLVK